MLNFLRAELVSTPEFLKRSTWNNLIFFFREEFTKEKDYARIILYWHVPQYNLHLKYITYRSYSEFIIDISFRCEFALIFFFLFFTE